ncbi:FAD:protein FMN transferase [Lacibacter luteus]|uniref:FAD:protein FMN transferase n=1 Tax=Lacibacter luteus TaxID=2508719 RepID=A0A4Q1CPK6_9BACT|nr:FAD:protein FMN transferase [Lacibacter luteus]RXK62834.1 FAD:protein FMN transferase [Lacibacter luteus]
MRILIGFLLLAIYPSKDEWKRYSISGRAQGTTYSVLYYAKDSLATQQQIDSVLKVLDQSLSLYQPNSLINQFNNSTKGLLLDEHLLHVVRASISTYKKTNGLFDATVFPLVEAWGFAVKKMNTIPDSATVRSLQSCVNSKWLQLKGNYLYKKKPCVKIDLNGIAQGYSVDVLAAFLESKNISNYLVEIGGEISVKGRKQPTNEQMKIGIESPALGAFDEHPLQKILSMDAGAITTSGSYRRYHETKGQKITHIINPKTGYPQKNELISVTVYAKDAMTADAYDNALMLMGLKQALAFVERRKDLAAYFVYKNANGRIADTASSAFLKLLNP